MKQLFEAIELRTDSAELFQLDSTVNLVMFENGVLKTLNTLNSKGMAVRAVVDGKLGQAVISDLRHPGAAADRIRKLATLGDPVNFQFSDTDTYPKLNLVDSAVRDFTTKEMMEAGGEAMALMKEYDSTIQSHFIAERSLDRVDVMTTNGAHGTFERLFYSFGVHAELVEPGNILIISRYAKGITMPPSPVEIARDVIENLRVGRKNVSFKPGKMPVLLAPTAMADILMAFTGAVDGDMAARKVSPLSDRLGETVLDPRITILDDPWHPDGIMSASCDDEGTPTQRKTVIDKGELTSFLTDRKAAATLGIPSSGNGFRAVPFERYKSFAEGLGIDFSNLIMEPGENSLDTVRGDINYGIEIHQINGILLGDLIGGDFSGSLELAYLIKNGERVGRIKNAMIGGNFFKIFKDQLEEITADRQWSGTFGGCSGAFLLPWLRVGGIEISGND